MSEFGNLPALNLAEYTKTDPCLCEKWLLKHYPQIENFNLDRVELNSTQLEIAFAIITDRNLKNYREISRLHEEAAK